MTFLQWMGLAVAAAAACMVVRVHQPQMASACAAAAGLMLLLGAMNSLGSVQQLWERITEMAGLREGYASVLLKVLGVSYAAELASQLCQDLGEGGLAMKVMLAGRLTVLGMTAPMLLTLLEAILELSP